MWMWVIFNILTVVMLVIDLAVFHRKAHEVRAREAAIWSGVWIGVSLLFNLVIFLLMGRAKALEFLTGYLIEKSLSVDNIFVFVLIFSYFKVPPAYQHRVLFWGVVGAIILRALFIFGGIALLHTFHWLVYLLGLLLIWGGIQMLRHDKVGVEPEKNKVLRLFRRFVPMLPDYEGARLIVRRKGRIFATPLMGVLIAIETTDIVFALDSIPAILAISRDPFIVYSSNICAILGLRALYFLFAVIVDRLRYLRYSLALILCFVGVKMAFGHWLDQVLTTGHALMFVAAALGVGVLASFLPPNPTPLFRRRRRRRESTDDKAPRS